MLGKSKIKYIQSLGQKKFRDETGLFMAEGPKVVQELLESDPGRVKQVYAVKEWLDRNNPAPAGIQVEEISETELEKISQLKTPNQVLAVAGQHIQEQIILGGQLTLALCGIQDPGNLGTIIRIADWFGLTQVVCSHDSADVYNPKVVQSTMGSIVRVNVHYLDIFRLLTENKDVPVFAATLGGKDVTKLKKPVQGLILVGNESKGIPDEILNLASEQITIPKKGKAESLNAGVATGIILSYLT
jgi:RNA methyltransferase, TrmH family